jgi:hypothetical protein
VIRWLAVILLVALGAGCNQQPLGAVAQLVGPYDLIESNDLIFVTSADRNELRALNVTLAPNTTVRDFVRAPNPLSALGIPVLDFPVELARDQGPSLTSDDVGPYLYARGDGQSAVSVVLTTNPPTMHEVRRIFTAAPVTAIAGRAPAGDGLPSTLYYATFDGVRGTLWQVALPPPDQITQATLAPAQIVSVAGTAIRSVVTLPAPTEVAVAMLPTVADPRTAWVLDTATLATRTLNFPSAVLRLFPQPGAVDPDSGNPVAPGPGERLFGILDDQYCVNVPVNNCPGFFVVDARPGQGGAEVLDYTGNPMVLGLGGGVPQGLVIVGGVSLNNVKHALVGAFTTSGGHPQPTGGGAPETVGGQLYFFDAQALTHFDTDSDFATANTFLETAAGNSKGSTDNGPQGVVPAEGAALDEEVSVTYQGVIPPLTDLFRVSGTDPTLNLPLGLETFAVTGDLAMLGSSQGPCQDNLPIIVTGTVATLTGGVPPDCADQTLFSIRAAGGPSPFVVVGQVSGFMGRTGPGQSFAFPADVSERARRYYFHPPDYNPAVAQLTFNFVAGDTLAQNDRYVITVTSGYRPMFIWPDPTVFFNYSLPRAIAMDAKESRGFAAYPSTPAMLEVNLNALAPGVANGTSTLVEHR